MGYNLLGAFQIVAGRQGLKPGQTAVADAPTDHSFKTIMTIWDTPNLFDINIKRF